MKGNRMSERARIVGIGRDGNAGFNDDRICSNTINSHRLVAYVTKTYGCSISEELFDILNYEHFVLGKNLNSREMLLNCCRQVSGLKNDIATINAFLDTDQLRNEVKQSINTLVRSNLDHIPVFVVNNTKVIDGAPTAATFITEFRKIEKQIKDMESSIHYRDRMLSHSFDFTVDDIDADIITDILVSDAEEMRLKNEMGNDKAIFEFLHNTDIRLANTAPPHANHKSASVENTNENDDVPAKRVKVSHDPNQSQG